MCCALAGGAMGRWLSASPKAQKIQSLVFGTALIGFGLLRDVGRAAAIAAPVRASGGGVWRRPPLAAGLRGLSADQRQVAVLVRRRRDASPRSSSSDIPLVGSTPGARTGGGRRRRDDGSASRDCLPRSRGHGPHDQQPVQRAHRGQPVRHHQRAAAFHQALHGLLDQHLAFAVQAGRGLIQDQDGRVREEGARSPRVGARRRTASRRARPPSCRQPLGRRMMKSCALACRAACSISACVAPGWPERCSRPACGGTGWAPAARSRSDGAAGLLRLGDVLSVDQDAAFVDVVQALDQLDERGLAEDEWPTSRRARRGAMLVQRRVARRSGRSRRRSGSRPR